MSRTIYCQKLKIEAEGLTQPPYPGVLGQKVFDSISQQAWDMWLAHQTMLINEYRLNMLDVKAREFLKTEMNNFLFGNGSATPQGYVPQK